MGRADEIADVVAFLATRGSYVNGTVIHVNGDDPEAVIEAAEFVIEYRQKFQKDVVMDLFCYRRHGHNEADEPAFTQPLMYQKIAAHPTTREIYAEKLIDDGIVTREHADSLVAAFYARCEEAFVASDDFEANEALAV